MKKLAVILIAVALLSCGRKTTVYIESANTDGTDTVQVKHVIKRN